MAVPHLLGVLPSPGWEVPQREAGPAPPQDWGSA